MVITTIPSHLNGDGSVNIDAIIMAKAFNSSPTDSNWNLNADINGDNPVNIYDAILLVNSFGKSGG